MAMLLLPSGDRAVRRKEAMLPLVKVLVDSTAGINPALARKWGIGVVPLYLTWGERTYRDLTGDLPGDFYTELARARVNPVTAAPNPADFFTAYQEAQEAGFRQILVVTASAEMSATHSHAHRAAEEIGGGTVVVLDSGQGAGAQALIAAHAARVAMQGAPLADVAAAAREAGRSTQLFMAVDTLRFLRRSGRLSGPQASLGELIQLKPILTFRDGRLHVVEKPRTMRRAVGRLIERVAGHAQQPAQVLIMHANTPVAAEGLAALIRQRWDDIEIDTSPVSWVVGGHTGPGLLGLAVRRQGASAE